MFWRAGSKSYESPLFCAGADVCVALVLQILDNVPLVSVNLLFNHKWTVGSLHHLLKRSSCQGDYAAYMYWLLF